MLGFLYSLFLALLVGLRISCTNTQTLPNLYLFAPLGNRRPNLVANTDISQRHIMGRSTVGSKIDPLYLALLHQRHHDYEACADVCTKILEKSPADEAVWSLKTRALTAQVMVDDIEGDNDESIVDLVLDDNALRAVGTRD